MQTGSRYQQTNKTVSCGVWSSLRRVYAEMDEGNYNIDALLYIIDSRNWLIAELDGLLTPRHIQVDEVYRRIDESSVRLSGKYSPKPRSKIVTTEVNGKVYTGKVTEKYV